MADDAPSAATRSPRPRPVGARAARRMTAPPQHVTGAAIYIDDIREPAGSLHVAPGFAPDRRAGRITSLDLDAVRGRARRRRAC